MMSRRHPTAVVVSLVLLGALGACTPDEPEPGTRLGCSALRPGADGYAVSGYELREVRPDPYARVSANLVDLAEGRTDAAGAFVPELPNDLGPGYHPVGMAQHALWSLGSYRATDDPAYLDRAVATAGALLDGATSAPDGSLWFAYPWDHLLHGEEQMQLQAPWFSGMAQGQALHLFSELAAETGEQRWRDAADGAFASYTSDGAGDFTRVDDSGCLWFEEYVGEGIAPTSVINGHIYSAWGLYAYHQLTGSREAEELFDGAATTLLASADRFRMPGKLSYYCAGDYCHETDLRPANYHRGVARQLDTLGLMTGDVAFLALADQLDADYRASGSSD